MALTDQHNLDPHEGQAPGTAPRTNCPHCSLPLHELECEEAKRRRIVYVLDKDLYRFGKWTLSVIGIIAVLGAIYLGFRLDKAFDEVRILSNTSKDAVSNSLLSLASARSAAADITEKARTATEKAQQGAEEALNQTKSQVESIETTLEKIKTIKKLSEDTLTELRSSKSEAEAAQEEARELNRKATATFQSAETLLQSARDTATGANRAAEKAKELVGQIEADRGEAKRRLERFPNDFAELAADAQRFRRFFEPTILAVFKDVLPEGQLEKLQEKLTTPAKTETQSVDQLKDMITKDVDKAISFFRKNGFNPPAIMVEAHQPKGYLDNLIVIEQGKLKFPLSSEFTYEPGYAYTELSSVILQSRFNVLGAVDDSFAIDYHIRMVTAAVIRGVGWEIGAIKSVGGTIIPAWKMDSNKPDRMSDFVVPTGSLPTRKNTSILNKAAVLMCDGGSQYGVTVSNGIGRENLGKLFCAVVRRLNELKSIPPKFIDFRNIVVAEAEKMFDRQQVDTVIQAFKAVGL